MPNHCYNELILNGSDENVQAVLAFIASDQDAFDFNTILPYPERYKLRDDDYHSIETDDQREAFIEKYGSRYDGYNSGGCEWCRENWGTKWNAYEVECLGARLFFQTAWAPPIPVIVALAKHFPDVTFNLEYFERGMQFAGGFTCIGTCDYYESDEGLPFEAGRMTDEWYTNEYRGCKGG